MWSILKCVLIRFRDDSTGASMVEYGLLLALIASACLTAVTALGTAVTTNLSAVAGNL
jgi:Flp pilus assembly pilin Flp